MSKWNGKNTLNHKSVISLIYNEDVITACDVILEEDDRKGFVYVNGASLFAQRPEFNCGHGCD